MCRSGMMHHHPIQTLPERKVSLDTKKRLAALFMGGLAVGALCWRQNNLIETSFLHCKHSMLPPSFEGYNIVHVSDLHNKQFGKNQQYLISQVKRIKPDMIVITGDLIDTTDSRYALDFLWQAVELAPVYYVPGNHEKRYGMFPFLKQRLSAYGAHVLDDCVQEVHKNGETILIAGIKDPTFYGWQEQHSDAQFVQTLQKLCDQTKDRFSILLSHRPERIHDYACCGFPLVFAGHAHGGQFCLPGIGAVMSPGQGISPHYTDGMYCEDGTTMVVSRGLGNSAFPLRLGNHPHLLSVTLCQK